MDPDIEKLRKIGHPILDVLKNRWSPRAMTGEEISDDELMSLFEAARWGSLLFQQSALAIHLRQAQYSRVG